MKRVSPLTRRRTVQLVFLCGPPGAGKSRVARELIRSWEAKRSDGKIIYLTASEFAAQFAQASTDAAIQQFQRRYRKDVVLFVCEDLQAIAGRSESQQQLIAVIDDVLAGGGCLLFTSTAMPAEIRGISKRLVNRIHGGLCVDIPLPGASSRRELLEHFLKSESIQLSADEISDIAQKHEFSPREIQGLIQQFKGAQRSLSGAGMSATEVLESLVLSPKYSLPEIASATAKVFGVRVADLKSPRRSQTISIARQVAMHLARELTDLNLKTVGEYFGRGNHSTVIHSCKKIASQIASDSVLAHNVEAIEKRLNARS